MRTANPMGIFLSAQFAAISASQDFIGFPYTFPVETPRNFTTLSAAGSMYYSLNDTVEMPGDFEIEFKFCLKDLTGNFIFASDGSADNDWFRIDATNGGFDWNINGLFRANDGTITSDNKLHIVKFSRVGTTMSVFYDGVLSGSHTSGAYASTVSIGAIGRRGGATANYFDGIIADVKLLGGEINGVPTPVLYTIDEDWVSSTNLNNNATIGGLGDAAATNITASESESFDFIGGDWLATDNTWTLGDYTSTGSEGTFIQVLGDTSLTIGMIYQTSLVASGFTSGEMRYRQISDEIIVSADGSYTSNPFTAVNTDSRIRTGTVQPNSGATFSNIAVKRILEVAP